MLWRCPSSAKQRAGPCSRPACPQLRHLGKGGRKVAEEELLVGGILLDEGAAGGVVGQHMVGGDACSSSSIGRGTGVLGRQRLHVREHTQVCRGSVAAEGYPHRKPTPAPPPTPPASP